MPAQPGLDAAGILERRGRREHRGRWCCSAPSPNRTSPTASGMRAGLDAVPFVVAVGAFTADAAARADVFLPTSVWGEKAGSTTNLEGRVLRMARLITPEGHDDGRLAHRAGAGDALRRRLRLRDGRRRAGRDRPRGARRSPGSTPSSCAAPATARCCRSPTSPTRSCSRRCSASRPDARGSRSSPGSPPTSRTCRRSGPARWPRAAAGPTRSSPASPAARARKRTKRRRGGGRGGHRRARGAARAPRVGPPRTPPVPTPPDAYSLRLVAARTLYDAGRLVVVEPVAAGARRRHRAGRAPERPQPHRRERRGRRRARHHAARHRHAAGAGRRRHCARHRVHGRSPRAATSVPTTSSTSPPRSPSCAWRPPGDAP